MKSSSIHVELIKGAKALPFMAFFISRILLKKIFFMVGVERIPVFDASKSII